VKLGIAPDATAAANFLNNYVPAGGSVAGTTSGSPDLQPERGRSWTVGGVFAPPFVPRFQFSMDYIHVEVLDIVRSVSASVAAQFCFDSPSFPDTSEALGTNVCGFFSREPVTSERAFNIANGFNTGYVNLGAIKVNALNMSAQYSVPLSGFFGEKARLSLNGSAYHLIDYVSSNVGDFSDAIHTEGDFTRPKWEVQGRARFENRDFFAQWVVNWQNATKYFTSGAPAGVEVFDVNSFNAYAVHDATFGFNVGEDRRFGLQFTIRNLFDKRFAADPAAVIALFDRGYIDDIGRRFSVQANLRF
jgi:hypothetical protein